MTAVALSGVSREYRVASGSIHALDDINLEVLEGQTVAMMGPSGCGKSTLISVIGGLERPTSGRVEVLGHDLGAMREAELTNFRKTGLGFIFQSYDLMPFLTALENVELQTGLAGRGQADARRLLQEVGLGVHIDKLPDQLSGGQKQRVGIARAVAHHPQLILADEPTGGLDAETSEAVMTTLMALVRDAHATLVLVTHDEYVAARCDRTVRLSDGRIATDDTATVRTTTHA